MTPDERERLVEERDFLLRSLADLEAERRVADIDDDDFASLKASYTARAAEVLRRLDDAPVAERPRRRTRPWRMAAWTVAVVALAVVAGVVVARNAGERLPGQTMTGSIGDGSVSSLLVQARSTGMSDIPRALDLYSQVLAQEPDNVEALTYFGWMTILSATTDQNSDDATVRDRFQSGLLLLRQATVVDATYPDAHCFLGIAFFRFLDDAEAADPEVRACLDSDPPAEVESMVEALAAQIAEANG